MPGDRVRLRELFHSVEWPDVERALLQLYPSAVRAMPRFEALFLHLRGLPPRESQMRICLDLVPSEVQGRPPHVEVCGRDGTRNCDDDRFVYSIEDPDLEVALAEKEFNLRGTPWRLWLGMSLDAKSLEGHSHAEIVGYCLCEMTWDGFDEVSAEAMRIRSLVCEH